MRPEGHFATLGLPLGAWLAVLAGFVVRVAFLAGKPLWRDEAWVALISSDPLGAASAGRAAPLGFLALTKLVVSLAPFSPEVSYRLVPLVTGVAAIAALARWAVSLGATPSVATVVAWLAAGVPPLVYYSRELKSYDLDLLLAIVAPMAASAAWTGPRSVAASAAFVVVAIATPWMSFGGIFAVAAVFAWGWVAWWRGMSPSHRRWWIAANALFLASFATVYAVALGAQSADRWMHQYWSFHLTADRRLWLPARLALALWDYASVSTRYFFPESWPVAVVLALVGAWTWPRSSRSRLAFLFATTALACATAAALDRYLIVNGRLLLFAAPVPLLWIAHGLVVATRRLGRGNAAVAAAVALSLWWSAEAIGWRVGDGRTRPANFFRHDVLQDVDAAIEAAARLIPRGETMLVSRKASYAFQFYYDGEPIRAAFCVRDCRGANALARNWLRRVDRRAWILLTDEEIRSMRQVVRESGLLERHRFEARGVRLWQVRRPGGAAVTDRPRRGSGPPRRPVRPARS